MLVGTAKQVEQASVAIMCGYDLLARAVHDTLREAGFRVEIRPVGRFTMSSKSDLLILDDAAIHLGDNSFQPTGNLANRIIFPMRK